jgi:hypothetical protein
MPSILLSSAQVVLFVNGNPFGRVSRFSYSVDTPRRKIHTVDSVLPFELATGVTNVSGSMGLYRTHLDGAVEGPGMVAPLEELPREKYFNILLIDLVSQTVVFQADFCSVESQSWSFEAKGLASGSVSFSALSYNNEVRKLG